MVSRRTTALGDLENVDSSKSSKEKFSSISTIARLGVSGRRWAAKVAAPYHSEQSGPVKASPEVYSQRRCFWEDSQFYWTSPAPSWALQRCIRKANNHQPPAGGSTGVSSDEVAPAARQGAKDLAPTTGESQVISHSARVSRGEHRAASPSSQRGVSSEQFLLILAWSCGQISWYVIV